jgi:tetratricopeptide (TPR) repeat protein
VRLSRLGEPSIRVAHAIAVLGAAASLRLVAALAGVPEVDTAGAIDGLVSADILAAGLPLAFAHPLLGEAVYADAPPGERVLAHAQAARLLEAAGSPPERVAVQLLAADPGGYEEAVATLRAAAREAMARGAPRTAAHYLERALGEPPVATVKREVLLELGVAESRAAQPNAADHLAEALRLTEEPVARARVARDLAGLYNLLGRFVESAAVLERAIDDLDETERVLRFSLEAEVAVLAVTSRDARQRLTRRVGEFRARAPAMIDEPAAAPLLAVVAQELAETDGTAAEATLYAERAFENAGLLGREGAVLGIGAATLAICDQPKRAEAILDGAISEAQARGSLQGLGVALVARAFARNRRGRIAEAEADARLSLELFPSEFGGAVRVLS